MITIRQPKALGLGHAILTAKPIVGNEPFAILLGDDIVFADKPVIGEMIKVFRKAARGCRCHYGSPKDHTQRYGICSGQWDNDKEMRVKRMVEKPIQRWHRATLGSLVATLYLPKSSHFWKKRLREKAEKSTDGCTTYARSYE